MRPDREAATCGDCSLPQDFFWSQDSGGAIILCQTHYAPAPGWAYDEMNIPLEHPEQVASDIAERHRQVLVRGIRVGWRVRRPFAVEEGVVLNIEEDGYVLVHWRGYQVPVQPIDLTALGVDLTNAEAVSRWLAD